MLIPIQCLMFLMLLFSSREVHADVLTFRADYSCPYVCDPQSSEPGYMVELLKTIFKKEGIPIEVKITNWARSIQETRMNIAQGLIATSKGDAPDLIYPVKAMGATRPAIYTQKNSPWSLEENENIEGRRIGIINGYWYGKELNRLLKSHPESFVSISGERPINQILKMIQNKRLDAFVENSIIVDHTLKEQTTSAADIKQSSLIPVEDPYLYVAFSPKNSKSRFYAHIINKGMEHLRKTGQLEKILSKYDVEDWHTPPKLTNALLNDFGTCIFKSSFNFINVLDARSL